MRWVGGCVGLESAWVDGCGCVDLERGPSGLGADRLSLEPAWVGGYVGLEAGASGLGADRLGLEYVPGPGGRPAGLE